MPFSMRMVFNFFFSNVRGLTIMVFLQSLFTRIIDRVSINVYYSALLQTLASDQQQVNSQSCMQHCSETEERYTGKALHCDTQMNNL